VTRAILTAAGIRAAEAAAIAGGTPVETLMERAGAAVAEAAWRFAGPLRTLILAGPGNNGGDGYVAARHLQARGIDVTVAALGAARAGAAAAARAAWPGPVVPIEAARPAPLLIDALFGTGLARGLDAALADRLAALAGAARATLAVDLPSGVATDSGQCLSPVPRFDLTVALGALKLAHRLRPAADRCGRVAVAAIGLAVTSDLAELGPPLLPPPGPEDHKYTRGQVAIVAGIMPGAARLAALAAAHAGAGYVLLFEQPVAPGPPHAIVHRAWHGAALDDPRIGAVVVGPGLGRDGEGRRRLDAALGCGRPCVIDGDALHLLDPLRMGRLAGHVLTPHDGEFRAAFGDLPGSKLDRARAAAARTGAVIVDKGADTVIAAPDGRAAIAPPASSWLSTAGTGDVLAGAIGALLARGMPPFDAATAGVWLHGRAAGLAGPAFVADDLARRLSGAL
jgi:hydroxyethylthiazole kinase-like uncharacterized protein yjeF